MIIPVFDRTGHQLLWGWLSSHPGMLLYDWPGWKDNGGTYSSCKYANFACQYDLDMRMLTRCYNEYSIANKKCLHCPFGNYAHKECLNHLYLKWLSATKVYSALKITGISGEMDTAAFKDITNVITKHAARIRDLPIRKDMTIKTR